MTPHEFGVWREKHGLTQSQAADALGISIRVVANYERGQARGQSEKPLIIPKAIKRVCDSLDRKRAVTSALRSKIKDKIRNGPPGHITPEILQEILLEIVDAI